MNNQKLNILIAGGKTGGHLFPGIAIAQALEKEHPRVKILFAGIGTKFETNTILSYGFSHARLYSKPIKGKNPLSLIFAMFIIPISIFQSFIIIKQFKPSMVIGTGGYSSFGVVLAAWLMGIKTAIQEQNTIPGLTNRILGNIATTIFLTFKDTKQLSKNKKSIHTGNPVRKIKQAEIDSEILKNINKDKFTLLISGGSQGAKSMNKAVIDALKILKNIDQYNIIHQTGDADEKNIQGQYSKLDIKNTTVKSFFNNLGLYQDIADLIISRAGAGTISEINLKGLPAILIPYPYAADDHQTSNAKELEKTDAAIVIADKDLTGEILKKNIESLKNNKDQLEKMSKASLGMAMKDADIKIAKKILKTTLGIGE